QRAKTQSLEPLGDRAPVPSELSRGRLHVEAVAPQAGEDGGIALFRGGLDDAAPLRRGQSQVFSLEERSRGQGDRLAQTVLQLADVPLLASQITVDAAVELGRPGVALSEDAMAALRSHAWPGNVRELQNCLRQAVALAAGPLLKREDLRLPAPERRGVVEAAAETGDAAVLASLRRHGFDMQATARELGWDRSTVTQRLKGLGFRALVEAGGDRARAALDLAGDPQLARAVELKLRED